MTDREISDILILGAGPAGLFAAFYAGMREMSTKIVEALPQPGGQLAVLYPEKTIYDVAGIPRIVAKDLVRDLVERDQRGLGHHRSGSGMALRPKHPDSGPW